MPDRCIGVIGLGRLGKIVAARLADYNHLVLYDRNSELMGEVAQAIGAMTADSLEEVACCNVVLLAVPDREVISCIKDFNLFKKEIVVINMATNVAQAVLEQTAIQPVKCMGVKFVGHAGEMALGLEPVIIVNERPQELVEEVSRLFAPVGHVIVGRADMVTEINTIAAEKALEAGVLIEEALTSRGYGKPEIIQSAIQQVGAGILKAYATDDLGPFAREIVRTVKAKMQKKF